MSKELENAIEHIKEQDAVLAKVLSATTEMGLVLDFSTRKLPEEGMREELSFLTYFRGGIHNLLSAVEVAPGQVVDILATDEYMSIVNVTENSPFLGVKTVVEEVIDKKFVICSIEGRRAKLYSCGKRLEEGDEVFANEVAILEKVTAKKVVTPTGVEWDDIGGLKEVKAHLKSVIEDPLIYKELYKQYNKKPAKGVLFYGPPGNGKTMLGKAVATSLRKLSSIGEDNFFYVKGPELLDPFVGRTEQNIRSLFNRANKFFDKYGVPAVIFLDEAESLLSARGMTHSPVDKTVVAQFLTEMDGINQSKCFIILATNRMDQLDSAVIREGRIDAKIMIGIPDIDTVTEIVRVTLNPLPFLEKGIDKFLVQELYKNRVLYSVFLEGDIEEICLRDVLNGAMIVNIVQSSINNALRRDIEDKAKTPSGVKKKDVVKAIENLYLQHLKVPHDEHVRIFTDELKERGKKIVKVEKLKNATIRTEVKEERIPV